MRTRVFWIFFVLTLVLGASAFLAYEKIKTRPLLLTPDDSAVVVVPNDDDDKLDPVPSASSNFVPLDRKHCQEQTQYQEYKKKLGILVNTRSDFRRNDDKFAAAIDKFRRENGFPLPLGVKSRKLEAAKVVYNNCRRICHGAVNLVFVSRVLRDESVEVLSQSGKLTKVGLVRSDLEMAHFNELNNKGVPFRSWQAPMGDGPWFIKGQDLYTRLDIRGLALKMSTQGQWTIVAEPKDAIELKKVAEPLNVSGCTLEEDCFIAEGVNRKFKAPKTCPSVVGNPAASQTSESSPLE